MAYKNMQRVTMTECAFADDFNNNSRKWERYVKQSWRLNRFNMKINLQRTRVMRVSTKNWVEQIKYLKVKIRNTENGEDE